jgi:uncharacterized protein (DUF433 family)
MDEHPLVRFADGPSGRRARLVGTGSDVWEVIAAVKDNEGDLAATAEYLRMALGLVQAAVAYYGAFQAEIDERIEHNARATAEAHEAGHFGMIFLPGDYRRTKADVGRIVIALQATLVQHPGESDLANGETWL